MLTFRENFKKDMKRFDHHISDLRKQLVGRYAAVEKVHKKICIRARVLHSAVLPLRGRIEEIITVTGNCNSVLRWLFPFPGMFPALCTCAMKSNILRPECNRRSLSHHLSSKQRGDTTGNKILLMFKTG